MEQTIHPGLDLEAYFHRIGFTGNPAPTLAALSDIQLRHALTIPWEDLDLLLKRSVNLDLASLTQKLIFDHRGGYCFEQNTLLKAVLEAIGFAVTGLQARVLWMVPEGVLTARAHMALMVRVDDTPYLVDVGFGTMTQTVPLRLEPDCEQATTHEPFRLVSVDHDYIVQARIRGVWMSLYRLSLDPCCPNDYAITNYYVSTHPNSMFYNVLYVTRPAQDCRYTLRGNEYAIHTQEWGTERRRVETVAEMRTLLTDVFLINLPETPELDPILQQVIADASSSA